MAKTGQGERQDTAADAPTATEAPPVVPSAEETSALDWRASVPATMATRSWRRSWAIRVHSTIARR